MRTLGQHSGRDVNLRDGTGLGDFRKAWNRARQAAGVHTRLFHDMRRGAARDATRAGVPEPVVMELGWRTRSMLARYNVVRERDLTNALEGVSQYTRARAFEGTRVQPLRAEPAQ